MRLPEAFEIDDLDRLRGIRRAEDEELRRVRQVVHIHPHAPCEVPPGNDQRGVTVIEVLS